MTNRVTVTGKLLDAPKVRTFEARGGAIEIVSLWIEVKDENRADRFTVEINCPKAAAFGKAMRPASSPRSPACCVTIAGRTRASGKWTGKVYIAIDPAAGTVRSKGLAGDAQQPAQAA